MEGYIHLDDAGGIRLYDNFGDAIEGNLVPALELVEPSVANRCAFSGRCSAFWRGFKYELATNRDQVDTTVLAKASPLV